MSCVFSLLLLRGRLSSDQTRGTVVPPCWRVDLPERCFVDVTPSMQANMQSSPVAALEEAARTFYRSFGTPFASLTSAVANGREAFRIVSYDPTSLVPLDRCPSRERKSVCPALQTAPILSTHILDGWHVTQHTINKLR